MRIEVKSSDGVATLPLPRSNSLSDLPWVFADRRGEIVGCRACGAPVLSCEESLSSEGVWTLSAGRFDDDAAEDEDDLDTLEGDEEPLDAAPSAGEQVVFRRLIAGHVAKGTKPPDVGDSARPAAVNLETGQVLEEGEAATVSLVHPDDKGRLCCPRCGATPRAGREAFRPLRLGMPFYLNVPGVPAPAATGQFARDVGPCGS